MNDLNQFLSHLDDMYRRAFTRLYHLNQSILLDMLDSRYDAVIDGVEAGIKLLEYLLEYIRLFNIPGTDVPQNCHIEVDNVYRYRGTSVLIHMMAGRRLCEYHDSLPNSVERDVLAEKLFNAKDIVHNTKYTLPNGKLSYYTPSKQLDKMDLTKLKNALTVLGVQPALDLDTEVTSLEALQAVKRRLTAWYTELDLMLDEANPDTYRIRGRMEMIEDILKVLMNFNIPDSTTPSPEFDIIYEFHRNMEWRNLQLRTLGSIKTLYSTNDVMTDADRLDRDSKVSAMIKNMKDRSKFS